MYYCTLNRYGCKCCVHLIVNSGPYTFYSVANMYETQMLVTYSAFFPEYVHVYITINNIKNLRYQSNIVYNYPNFHHRQLNRQIKNNILVGSQSKQKTLKTDKIHETRERPLVN